MSPAFAAACFTALILLLAAATAVGSRMIGRKNPPSGAFADIAGTRMHFVHLPAPGADLPPVLFIHGASGNLRDQMLPSRPLLETRAELLYLDRPGHGWSARGQANETLAGQADTIAGLMDHLGMGRAILVGHSLGGAVAAAFALRHSQRVAGLVFIAPATHPWPGGASAWYYRIAAAPLVGHVFTALFSLPAGMASIATASAGVFSPNPMPEGYVGGAGIELVLRPASFRSNARDVASLSAQLERIAPHYHEIAAPTVIVTGDHDAVVYEELHSGGLKRDIAGAELVWVRNLGHKPDWIAPDLVVSAIEKAAGRDVDPAHVARLVEDRIAGDDAAPRARRGVEAFVAEASR
jgi:pimeloyl-ACP methyl ester carboxylesterase